MVNKYVITGKNYVSDLFVDPALSSCRILTESELANSCITLQDSDMVYATSESCLHTILQHMNEDSRKRQLIAKLKDKFLCRRLLSDYYPDFNFSLIATDRLCTLQLGGRKVVVKPRRGFFGVGVEIIEKEAQLDLIQEKIIQDLKSQSAAFGDEVLSANELIVEDFIQGDIELAVDVFFDEIGHPVITNIARHPRCPNNNYRHVLYYSSKLIYNQYWGRLQSLLTTLNQSLGLTCFPIHAEFLLDNDRLVPVEFNPLRFGGFGLADLPFYAFGFNPYVAYFNSEPFDWSSIKNHSPHVETAFILGYNGDKVRKPENFQPNHLKFKNFLGPVIRGYRQLHHTDNPAFCVAYKILNTGDKEKILNTDFNAFFDRIFAK